MGAAQARAAGAPSPEETVAAPGAAPRGRGGLPLLQGGGSPQSRAGLHEESFPRVRDTSPRSPLGSPAAGRAVRLSADAQDLAGEGELTFVDTIFTVANTMIGASVLNLPYAVAQVGVLPGVASLVDRNCFSFATHNETLFF